MPRATITLVHARACHHCEDAQEALAELGREFDFTLNLVASDSATGRDLVAAYRPAMFPLVLVGGAFFSAGRLPRRKLRSLLARPAVVSRA